MDTAIRKFNIFGASLVCQSDLILAIAENSCSHMAEDTWMHRTVSTRTKMFVSVSF